MKSFHGTNPILNRNHRAALGMGCLPSCIPKQSADVNEIHAIWVVHFNSEEGCPGAGLNWQRRVLENRLIFCHSHIFQTDILKKEPALPDFCAQSMFECCDAFSYVAALLKDS